MLRLARDWGVHRIEMTAGMDPMADPLDCLSSASDFDFLLHNYFPTPTHPFVLNLASEDPDTLTRSKAHCREALRISGALGAPVFSVHAGFAANVQPEHLGRQIPLEHRTDRARALTIFEDSIGELIPIARDAGVRLCVENNVVSSANLVAGENQMLLLATAEELNAFIETMNSDWIGLLVDVGHVKVTCESLQLDADQYMANVAPNTTMLHLSDNNGRADSNMAFGNEAWFVPHLARFTCDIAVVEAYNLTPSTLASCLAAIGASDEPV